MIANESKATIPTELMLIANTATIATSAVTSQTREERKETLSAIALLFGAEERIRSYLTDPTVSTEAKTLASQILTSLHPGPHDFVPTIRVPCEKRLTLPILIELAERSVATASQMIRMDLNHQFISEAIGYGRILADAEAQCIKLNDRGKHLLECCRRIEAARANGNPDADIGYRPLPNPDDNQMKFSFYMRQLDRVDL